MRKLSTKEVIGGLESAIRLLKKQGLPLQRCVVIQVSASDEHPLCIFGDEEHDFLIEPFEFIAPDD